MPPMTAADGAKVVFTPSGLRGRVPIGDTVLDAARQLGVDLDSVCGGRGLCGRCQVEPTPGTFPKFGIESSLDHLSSVGDVETAYEARHGLAAGRRLGCMAKLGGDLVIDVPADSQVHRQVVRKRVEVDDLVLDPVLKLHYLDVDRPQLDRPSGDLERVAAALDAQWGIAGMRASPHVLDGLQDALRHGDWTVTVAVRDGAEIVAVWPGFRDIGLGVAVDVGSTTIAVQLCDLTSGAVLASAGRMNPQIRFGEDLMSRVSYVMLHPEGRVQLTDVVREALDGLIGEVVDQAGADRHDILELTVVGNPIMHHLLLGLDPRPLGEAPFALATDAAVTLRAGDLGLVVNEGARVYVLPCIAGHVGADAAAVILSESPHRSQSVQLVVDVGTNAEIVLGSSHRLLAASSPTGPAFEGAQISNGQRAAPGAIERVRIDKETLTPRFKVIGVEPWSDQPGFAEAAAATGVTGICGSGIIEVIAELFLADVISSDGVIKSRNHARVVADGRTFSFVLHDGPPAITLTQNDVRAIQLAKGALYAGARLLMDHLGVTAVDQIRFAGAFGSQIDVTYAMVLGLIPDCDLDQVSAAGNAASAGAMIALLNGASRTEIEEVVRNVEKIETATEARFQEHFVDALAFPHKTASYPHLARRVDLPTTGESAARPGRAGRRRKARGPTMEEQS